ncbi:porin family protein [Flectobacillus sp. DC10W]|jgi:opacity protein-like surface antigen|uniref:Porin family protein n=1 Tax=Flectobacillus longus TaxID=2984207 RepID=A0ABT6YRF9_9BACT|nr:porin family protein [Flectobacillus longus]MDI9866182.1 porin family protein [Flectobacillus longus]
MRNIKKFAVLALLCVCSPLLKAQNLSFGPTIGVNSSSLSGLSDTKSRTGLSTGLFLNYSSTSHWGFGMQVLYSQQGANYERSDDYLKLDYVQVPLLATYYFGSQKTTGSWRPKVFAGPQIGFLTSVANKSGYDYAGSYSSTDVSAVLGAGVNYALSQKMWLNLDARYALGLTDIAKSPTLDVSNRVFSVNVGLSFPLGTYK